MQHSAFTMHLFLIFEMNRFCVFHLDILQLFTGISILAFYIIKGTLCQCLNFLGNFPIYFQDRLYLQYVELNAFQNEFRELSNKFKENEKIIQKLQIHGTTLIEINEELDNLETVTKALSVDVYKAKKLAKTGETLMLGNDIRC